MESDQQPTATATDPSPPVQSPRISRRAIWLVGAAVLVVLLFVGAYHRHAFYDWSKTDFSEVEVAERRVMQKGSSKPFSGTLQVRDGDIAVLGAAVFAGTPVEQWTGADPHGLILEVSVVDGTLSGNAHLFADLRSPGLAGQLGSGLRFTLAKWFSPRQKVASAHFAESQLDGRCALWRPVGSKLALRKLVEAEFAGNQLHGQTRRFYPGGTVQSEMHFDRGAPTGVHKEFYSTGEIERETHFQGSRRERKAYYRNGQPRLLELEDSGALVSAKSWFPDGSQRRVASYRDGFSTSEQRWYSNGQLAFESQDFGPVEHPPHGTIQEFYDSGNLRSEHQYTEGIMHGPFKKYYDNEQLWEEGTYARGVLDGPHRKWWKNGRKALESTWREGQKQGPYLRWYASGQEWETATFQAGKREGLYRKHWMNGKLAHDYTYSNGRLEGPYATYYDNGQRRLEATYAAGRLHGDYGNWLKDGTEFEIATYDNGTKLTSSRQE